MDKTIEQQIKYLRDIERLSFPQIGEKLGISRVTCSRIYCGKVKKIRPKSSKLEEYGSLINEWYAMHPTLKALQVYERLQQRGVKVSYQSVVTFTQRKRAKKDRCYLQMTFDAGEEAQVDWFIIMHPILGKLYGFALVLSHSRFLFARIFPKSSFEFFIEGHVQAFDILGGITRALRYDNLKSVVIKKYPLNYNAAFLEFAHYYGFEIRLCNVRAGNEKGRVERSIRSIRETFLNTAQHHSSLRALNCALALWVHNKNNSLHRSTGKLPNELKIQEKLKPLPQTPWLNRTIHSPKIPTKTGMIHFDSNQYSIPQYLVNSSLSVHAFCDKIDIYDEKSKQVASHPRSFEKNKVILNPLHRSFSRLSSKNKAERIYAVIKNLDPKIDKFLQLSQKIGHDSIQTAHAIFQLLRSYPRSVIISAINEANSNNNYTINFVYSLLTKIHISHQEEVNPVDKKLLTLSYKPRSLEEYC